MADPRSTPPNSIVPNRPVPSYPTPIISDRIYTEVVSTEVGSYEALETGTVYNSSIHTSFTGPSDGFELVFQTPVDPNGFWIRRVWANPRINQQEYNYSVEYSGDDPDYPIVTRLDVVKREEYVPQSILSPDVMFPDALLVTEKMLNQTQPAEINSLYVTHLKIYEVLPGPWLPFTRYDDNLGPIQGMRRAVINTGQEASLTPTQKTTYEARNGSAIVSWELVEGWTNGSGESGNPPFPIQTSETWDDLKGNIHGTTQVVVMTGAEEASLTIDAFGVVTKIWYEPYNEFLLTKHVQTWTLPGPVQYDLEYPYGGLEDFPRIVIKQLVPRDSFVPDTPGSACPIAGFSSAVLLSQKLGSYDPVSDILVTIYDTIPTASDQDGFGYDITHPYGGLEDFPRLTWKFTIGNQAYSPATPGDACPIPGYTSAVLISESTQGDTTQNQEITVVRVYDIIPEADDQDGFGFSLSYMGDSEDFPIVTWRFVQPNDYTPATDLSACPIAGYTGLLLVSQATQGNNDQNQFISVQRVYKTLPGPNIPSNRYDNDLGAVDGTKREVVSSGQQATLTPTSTTRYESVEGSTLVVWEIIESWTNGISPAFPVQTREEYDNLRGPVQVTSQIYVAMGTEEGELSESGGVVTKITYQPFNQYLLRRIVETFDVPGPLTYSLEYPYGSLEDFPRIIARQTYAKGAYTALPPGTACTIPGFTSAVLISQKVDTDNVAWDVVTQVFDTIPISSDQTGFGFSLTYGGSDKDYPMVQWKFSIDGGLYTPANDLSSCPIPGYPSLLLVDQSTQGSQDQSQIIEVIRQYATLPGPYIPFTRYDDNLGPVQGQRRLVINTGQEASLTPTGKITYEGYNGSSLVSWEITESWTNGDGESGNPAFPIETSDTYDDLYGPVQTTVQLQVQTGAEVGSLVYDNVFQTVTKIWYEPFNQYLLRKFVQVFTVPGPEVFSLEYPYGGLENFPRIIVRQAFGKGQYTPQAPGTTCPIAGYTSAVLVTQKVDSPNEAVDVVTTVFDTIPVASDQTDFGYSIAYMDGNTSFPEIQWRFKIKLSLYSPEAPLSACPISGFTGTDLVEQTVQGDESQNQEVIVTRRFQTLPGPVTTTEDFDTQLDVLVYTDRQIVLATNTFNPTSPSGNLLTLDMKETPLTQDTKLRVRSYLDELPDSFTQFRTGRYNFPALVFDIILDIYQWTLTPDRSMVYWYPDMRGEPNVPALFKVTTEYFTSEPTDETLFVIPAGNLYYNGNSYNISLNNVLNDAITVQATFVDDAQYGDLDEPHTFSATPLTATAYSALIGTYQVIACDITRWRGNVWTKVTQELLII